MGTPTQTMSSDLVNIGINHPAYKVGKREILAWANDAIDANLSDVAGNVGDGAAYCQLLHSVNRKCVNLKMVKFDAKDDYGYNANYNILQKALKLQKIDKVIRPDALMRGKPLDNLEFIQWLKHYCTNSSSGDGYCGQAEREKWHPNLGKKDKRWAGSGKASSGGGADVAAPAAAKKPAAARKPAAPSRAAGGNASAASSAELQSAKDSLAEQTQMTEDLQLNVDALEKERDFYFGKLREIELLCQEREDDDMQDNEPLSTLVNTIKEIMYATDDADAPAAEEEEDEEDL